MRRGEIWWARLPGGAGKRPVLLLSRNEAYAVRALVTVAPLTTRIRRIPVEVPLGSEDGLPRECVINLDSLVTIRKTRLERRLAVLGREKLRAAHAALRFALALDALKDG